MVALIDFERLAAQYVAELRAEGINPYEPISAAAVVADLARLAGVPTPAVVSEADHSHVYSFDMPAAFGECVTCGATPF